jgi:hypothetical protein
MSDITYPSPKPTSHQANIVRVISVLPHNNADKLEIIHFTGSNYEVVAQKGTFPIGSLGIYVQPDSVVPQTEPFRFIWEPYAYAEKSEDGGYFLTPEKRRRITVKKLRGVYSEGLLLPVSEFPELVSSDGVIPYQVGHDVSDVIGITHYDGDNEEGSGDTAFAPGFKVAKKKKRYPRTLKGWLFFLLSKFKIHKQHKLEIETDSLGLPTYDVENFRNHSNAFGPTDTVIVTEKIHGSNARYIFQDGKVYAGSKSFWKAPDSNCIWRRALKANPWIEEYLRANEGIALYGEVTPTQKGYDYGSKGPQFFLFDMCLADGGWWDKSDMLLEAVKFGLNTVPVLYQGRFEDFDPAELSQFTATKDTHISEGYVIATDTEQSQRGLHRTQLKVKSNSFLEKEGKAK